MKNPNAAKDREDFERFRQEIPESLWPPSFIDGAQAWYTAFLDICGDRSGTGMGVGALSWTVIDRYAQRMGISDFDAFAKCMKAMDGVYIKHNQPEGEKQEFSREMFRGSFNSK